MEPIYANANEGSRDMLVQHPELRELLERHAARAHSYSGANRDIHDATVEALAKAENVLPANVRLFGGGLPRLQRLNFELAALSSDPRCFKSISFDGDFTQYKRKLVERYFDVVRIPIDLRDIDLRAEEIIKVLSAEDDGVLFVTEPWTNPFARHVSKTFLEQVRSHFPRLYIVSDQAYSRNCLGYSFRNADRIAADKRLIVFNSMSKVTTYCGARLSWLVADADLLLALDPFAFPYPSNDMAKAVLCDVLDHPSLLDKVSKEQRAALRVLHDAADMLIVPAIKNMEVPWVALNLGSRAALINKALADRGVFCQQQGAPFEGWLRISATTQRQATIIATHLIDVMRGGRLSAV